MVIFQIPELDLSSFLVDSETKSKSNIDDIIQHMEKIVPMEDIQILQKKNTRHHYADTIQDLYNEKLSLYK